MSGILSLMVGRGGVSVDIVGGSIIHTPVTPTDAFAAYFLNNTGTETSDPAGIVNTWLKSGAAADYDVRATVTAGALTGGDLAATWLNLGTSRTWSVSNTVNAANVKTADLTIEVRSAVTLAVLDSAAVTLRAEVFA